MHPDDQARFNLLRERHFPPGLNYIAAHLTMFHHLPGTEADSVEESVRVAAANQQAFEVAVTGLRSLGHGVAYTLASAPLVALRGGLTRHWHEHLTAQDRQGWRPHVTIQNKAGPGKAKALLAAMDAVFVPFHVRATGLTLWRYMGGPWDLVVRHEFRREETDTR